jgi:hypothetical protein
MYFKFKKKPGPPPPPPPQQTTACKKQAEHISMEKILITEQDGSNSNAADFCLMHDSIVISIIMTAFPLFPSVPPGVGPQIRPRLLPSKSLKIHCSLSILFNAIQTVWAPECH